MPKSSKDQGHAVEAGTLLPTDILRWLDGSNVPINPKDFPADDDSNREARQKLAKLGILYLMAEKKLPYPSARRIICVHFDYDRETPNDWLKNDSEFHNRVLMLEGLGLVTAIDATNRAAQGGDPVEDTEEVKEKYDSQGKVKERTTFKRQRMAPPQPAASKMLLQIWGQRLRKLEKALEGIESTPSTVVAKEATGLEQVPVQTKKVSVMLEPISGDIEISGQRLEGQGEQPAQPAGEQRSDQTEAPPSARPSGPKRLIITLEGLVEDEGEPKDE